MERKQWFHISSLQQLSKPQADSHGLLNLCWRIALWVRDSAEEGKGGSFCSLFVCAAVLTVDVDEVIFAPGSPQVNAQPNQLLVHMDPTTLGINFPGIGKGFWGREKGKVSDSCVSWVLDSVQVTYTFRIVQNHFSSYVLDSNNHYSSVNLSRLVSSFHYWSCFTCLFFIIQAVITVPLWSITVLHSWLLK